MNSMKKDKHNGYNSKPEHIDDVQPATVDEHLRILLADEDSIDYDTSREMTPADLPEWYDAELFKKGQRYFPDNMLGVSTATLAGLIAVFAIPSILKVLVFTKQGGTPCAAFRRYLETLFHNYTWHTHDVEDKNSDWYRTTNEVRIRHSNVSRRSLHAGCKGITYRDMALTQFGFIGYVLTQPKYLGLTNTVEEREGFVHFSRVLGHMIGIPDRINICRKNEAETTELCSKLKDQVFGKYFKEASPDFIHSSEVMLAGMWSADVQTDKDAFLALAYKLNDVSYEKPLGLYSRWNLKYRETSLKLCGTPYVGILVRRFYNYLLMFNYWLLKHWRFVAWLQYGIEESKLRLYRSIK